MLFGVPLLLLLQAAVASPSPQKPAPGTPRPVLRSDSTSLFVFGNSVNGGLVGAVGPSLHGLAESTGLRSAALGRLVMLNRASKLLGTLAWAEYAKHLQRCHGSGTTSQLPPQVLLAVCMAVSSLASLAIGLMRKSSSALHIAFCLSGFAYGLSDSGMTLLTMWALPEPKRQRTAVAALNAGFTVGAVLTPAIVASSLMRGQSCYPCFYCIAAVAALASWAFACGMGGRRQTHSIAHIRPPRAPQSSISQKSAHIRPPRAPQSPMSQERAAQGSAARRQGGGAGYRLPRDSTVVGCMAFVLFCVTGCEHAIGTWLPSFGHHQVGMSHSTMAMMTSSFWGAICIGRLAWAAFSHAVSTGFLVLGADLLAMLVSSACYLLLSSTAGLSPHAYRYLWAGTIGVAIGFASSIPCAYTLPTEARVRSTPATVLALNLGGTAGELCLPFLVGLAFERGRYRGFAQGLVALQLAALGATGLAWAVSR